MGKRQNILLERVSIMANKKMKTAVKSVKKQRTKKALKRTKVQSMENKKGVLFSIRAKIFLCFLVPILFLILVGVFSYKKQPQVCMIHSGIPMNRPLIWQTNI